MDARFYQVPVPGVALGRELAGKLIVLEGTDGVGRSTQMQLLRNWLESGGLAVHDTGLTRGNLAGRHIQQAKEGHTMGPRTQCLYYATDFADRLENEIIPVLRAGYVVLTDRYIYSLIARSAVRKLERSWLRSLYGFALRPDLILYLKVSVHNLVPRVVNAGGFDYWESGLDYLCEDSMYDAFIKHQGALLREFDQMAEEYGFVVVDADRTIGGTFADVQRHVSEVVAGMTPDQPIPSVFPPPIIETVGRRREERQSVGDRLRELLGTLFDDAE